MASITTEQLFLASKVIRLYVDLRSLSPYVADLVAKVIIELERTGEDPAVSPGSSQAEQT